MMNIAVFASGKGTNFLAIVRAVKKGLIKARLSLLVCDTPQAPVIKKAKRAGIKVLLVRKRDFHTTEDFEAKIIRELRKEKVGLIVLAGFMRILSPRFVRAYHNRILNIHPALLPSFKGTQGIHDAFAYGVKVTGVTVHFVDAKVDHGPIILQEPVAVKEHDTLASLEDKIHRVEHTLYPLAIQLVAQGRLKIRRRKVKLTTL